MESTNSIVLYHKDTCPPARAARLVAASLEVPLNLKYVDILGKKEQMQDWFLKMNPQHTIPTMVDGDFVLSESRAIMCYLANKYAPDSPLYPKCPQKRGLVDRFLYFDCGTLYKACAEYFYPKLIHNLGYDPEKETKLKEALGFLETFLGDNEYLVGNSVTIADLAIANTLTLPDSMDYVTSDYPKVEAYYKRLQKSPRWDEIEGVGIQLIRDVMKKMAKNDSS